MEIPTGGEAPGLSSGAKDFVVLVVTGRLLLLLLSLKSSSGYQRLPDGLAFAGLVLLPLDGGLQGQGTGGGGERERERKREREMA